MYGHSFEANYQKISIMASSKGGVRQFSRPVTASAFLQADKIQEIIKSGQGKKIKNIKN